MFAARVMPPRPAPAQCTRRPVGGLHLRRLQHPRSALLWLQALTWDNIETVLEQYHDKGRTDLTVVVFGKQGVGVSSTVNALLGERMFDVRPALQLRPSAEPHASVQLRKRGSTLLRIVHTHWLLAVRPASEFTVLAASLPARKTRVSVPAGTPLRKLH